MELLAIILKHTLNGPHFLAFAHGPLFYMGGYSLFTHSVQLLSIC